MQIGYELLEEIFKKNTYILWYAYLKIASPKLFGDLKL